jgi:hypothetical protein
MPIKTYAEVKQIVQDHNKATDFSNELIVAVAWKESGFDDSATNASSTATGLMQLTKGAVTDVNNNTPDGVHYEHSEMTDAAKNIECGTYYLQILRGRWGSAKDALNHFGTGAGYADNLLKCETCLKTTPDKWSDCLHGIHPIVTAWSKEGFGGTEGEFAKTLMAITQKLTGGEGFGGPTTFPHGIGNIEITATLEPQKISFSLKIADAIGKPTSPLTTGFTKAASSSTAADILNYCVSLDTSNDPVMTDCNAFVKKVAANFGVTIDASLDADGIVGSFGSTPFTKTTMDPAIAMSWANDGLVVAGMTKAELNGFGPHSNGHVAIVHNTADTAHPGFPMASWGSLGGRGQSNTSIRQSFPATACDADAMHFAFAPTS